MNILRSIVFIMTLSFFGSLNAYANPVGGDKITICHRTHSETNPYNKITVSSSAWGAQNAHSGHIAPDGSGDLILAGDVPCPSDMFDPGPDPEPEPDSEPPEEPNPSDDPGPDVQNDPEPIRPGTVNVKDEPVAEEVITALSELVFIERDVKDMNVSANFTSLKQIIDRLDARNSSFD